LLGSAGSEKLMFRVTSPGTATIGLAYSQPWAGGTKGAWIVRLAVIGS
jgi:predicted secreted protein